MWLTIDDFSQEVYIFELEIMCWISASNLFYFGNLMVMQKKIHFVMSMLIGSQLQSVCCKKKGTFLDLTSKEDVHSSHIWRHFTSSGAVSSSSGRTSKTLHCNKEMFLHLMTGWMCYLSFKNIINSVLAIYSKETQVEGNFKIIY